MFQAFDEYLIIKKSQKAITSSSGIIMPDTITCWEVVNTNIPKLEEKSVILGADTQAVSLGDGVHYSTHFKNIIAVK